jgi:hypothetical protein
VKERELLGPRGVILLAFGRAFNLYACVGVFLSTALVMFLPSGLIAIAVASYCVTGAILLWGFLRVQSARRAGKSWRNSQRVDSVSSA